MFKARTLKRACAVCLVMLMFLSVSGLASAVTLDKSFTFYMVPNAHIDTAWQWPFQHTAETIINATYGNMITRVKADPSYRFSTSASKHYQYAEEYYNVGNNSNYWDDLQTLVRSGQWDITGGQIVEPDLNVPSGESLARQGLYAQHYFEEKFGKENVPKTAFVPDVFGFSGQFPQIIKKTGMDYFVTSKLNWNDTYYRTANRESDIQWWQALDGKSNVLAYILSQDYTGSWSQSTIQTAFDRNWDRYATTVNTGVKTAMGFYGSGDHGGGPSVAGFQQPAQYNETYPSTVKMGSATEYFEDTVATQDLSKVPTHVGEYYFEYHRGTYTSWSRVKRYNRTNEILADSAEKAVTLSFWTGSVTNSSMDKISLAWDKILVNQMHDVLPGSSAPYVYYVAFNNHELAKNLLTNTQDNALAGLAYRADTNVSGTPVFVYNPLSWERTDYTSVELTFATLPASVAIYDGDVELPSTILARDADANTLTVSFEAADVPALGYKVFNAVAKEAGYAYQGGVSYDEDSMVMENEHLKLTINPVTGNIKSLINKDDGGREVFQQGAGTEANELHVYVDTGGGSYPAWDLIKGEINREPQYILNDAPDFELLEDTAERVTLRVTHYWLGSTVSQDITLKTGSDRVEVKMGVDWRENQRLLKVSFPIAADTLQGTYETGYGAVERPTMRTAQISQWPATGSYLEGEAKFEVPMHKWMDITDKSGAYGVSLLNDGKYGVDSLRRQIGTNGDIYIRSRITVVRSPRSGPLSQEQSKFPPLPHNIDLDYQEFNYAIYPHTGDRVEAGTVLKGYEFGEGLVAFQTAKRTGDLPAEKSFISINKDNVLITTVKNPYLAPEDKNTFIIRMYEATGRDTSGVSIKLPAGVVSAKEVNILEYEYEGKKPVAVNGDTITFDIGRYEILTLEVKINPYAGTPYTIAQATVDLSAFLNFDGVSSDSNRRDGDLDGNGNTVPVRNWPAKVDYQGITFVPAPAPANGENSYVQAAGQVIPAPVGSYNKIFLLGVSAGTGAAAGDFTVKYADGSSTEKNIRFADWHTDLSGWNGPVKADTKPYVYDSIAWVFTHYHGPTRDEATCDNYLFVYSIDVDSAKAIESITLPNAPGIKLVAVTAANSTVDGYASVYGSTPEYTVSTECAAPTNVVATKISDTGVSISWTPSETPDLLKYEIHRGSSPDFIPSANSLVSTAGGKRTSTVNTLGMSSRSMYYKVVAVNRGGYSSESSEASNGVSYFGFYNYSTGYVRAWSVQSQSNEEPWMACDDSWGTKWCTTGITAANGRGYLYVQLVPDEDEPVEIYSFEVMHGGVSEGTGYNTRDFNIDYSLDGENWVRAVTVTGNPQTRSITYHPLEEPVKARYTRLHVVTPTQTTDAAARIYEFRALGLPKVNDRILLYVSPNEVITRPAGQSVTAFVNLPNDTEEVKTYTVLAAAYNAQGVMAAYTTKTVSIEPGKPQNLAMPLQMPGTTTGFTYKAFVWDGDTYTPLIVEAIVR